MRPPNSTSGPSIPGYDYGSSQSAISPVSTSDLARLEQTVGWTEEDAATLERHAGLFQARAEQMVDEWRVVIGSQPHLVHSFVKPDGDSDDVRMMNFFRDMSVKVTLVVAGIVLLSMVIQNFWCRYLCPYGALLGLVSLISPVKIRRDTGACIDCTKCAHACPAKLPVDQLVQIRSVECSACMACVAACPAQDALQLALPPRQAPTSRMRWLRRSIGPAFLTVVLAYIFFGAVLLARATNHWQTDVPRSVYMRLVPQADKLRHPGL